MQLKEQNSASRRSESLINASTKIHASNRDVPDLPNKLSRYDLKKKCLQLKEYTVLQEVKVW